jgi:hypothetical protein
MKSKFSAGGWCFQGCILLLYLLILRSPREGSSIEGVSNPPSFRVLYHTQSLDLFDGEAAAFPSRKTANPVGNEGSERSKGKLAATTTIFSDRFSSPFIASMSMTYFAQTTSPRKNGGITIAQKIVNMSCAINWTWHNAAC